MRYIRKTKRRWRAMYDALRAQIAALPCPSFGPETLVQPSRDYGQVSAALRYLARRGEIKRLTRGHAGWRRTPAVYTRNR